MFDFQSCASYVNTQKALNKWEQSNILDAQKWAFSRKNSHYLTIQYCCELHERMFDKTWRWAGIFRRTNKNIGVFWEQIPMQLKLLFDDLQYQLDHGIYSIDELSSRFHHRLVSIHPFPNGNGRHARLYTDVILMHQDADRFTWGGQSFDNNTKLRAAYIAALRAADRGDYGLLFEFVRS